MSVLLSRQQRRKSAVDLIRQIYFRYSVDGGHDSLRDIEKNILTPANLNPDIPELKIPKNRIKIVYF